MTRECQVRFCERPKGWFLWSTRPRQGSRCAGTPNLPLRSCVTKRDASLSCCTKDEGRPFGFGNQLQEPNRPMWHELRALVVSDREKAGTTCQVRSEEMNVNEPPMRCRYVNTLSKLGTERIPRISADVSWIRAVRQPA